METQDADARLYIKEHIEAKGLSVEKAAHEVGVERVTVYRWINEPWRFNPQKQKQLAAVLGIEPAEFWHPPSRPSLDVMLKGRSDKDVQKATRILKDTFDLLGD